MESFLPPPPSACSQTRMERDTEITFRPQAVGSQRSAKCHWLAEFNSNPFGCLELRMAYRSLEKASPASTACAGACHVLLSTACAGACHVLFAQAAGHDGYVDVSERASLEALAPTHARGRAACAWPPLANEAVCWKSATLSGSRDLGPEETCLYLACRSKQSATPAACRQALCT